MNYNTFIQTIINSIETSENAGLYTCSEYAVKFAYYKKIHTGSINSIPDQHFEIQVCARTFDSSTGDSILSWFSDWIEFDTSDYGFDLYGVYNCEMLIDVFEKNILEV